MKTFYTFLGILFAFVAQAQVEDRTETDCDGNSQSIYEILETGKPLIVASKGLDCSICMGQADDLATFADNQPNITIWGAMFYLYADEQADCPSVGSWVDTYSWGNIFAFQDLEEFWAGEFGAPTYTVINPTTTEIVYAGGSFNTATNEALGLITVGLVEDFNKESFTLYNRNGNLNIQINSSSAGEGRIEVFNILGQNVFSKDFFLKEGELKIQAPFNQNSGIFIANLELNGTTFSKKFLLRQ